MSVANVTGIGFTPINQGEATSTKILDDYMEWMDEIDAIFNQPGKPPYTEDDYNRLKIAMNNLKDLALHGDTTTVGGPNYMPKDMLAKLNSVFSWLDIKGFKLDSNMSLNDALAAMAAAKTATGTSIDKNGKTTTYTFTDILENATSGLSGANKSLQSMLYTEFVLSTTEKYEKSLGDLEEQLKITKEIADALANIQDWRNRFAEAPNTPNWQNNDNVIGPSVKTPTMDDIAELKKYRDKLIAELDKLDPNPPGKLRKDDGSLASNLVKVINDLKFLDDPSVLQAELAQLPPNSMDANSLVQWAVDHGYITQPKNDVDVFVKYPEAIKAAENVRREWLTSHGYTYTNDVDAIAQIAAIRAESGKGGDPNFNFAIFGATSWISDSQNTVSKDSGRYQDNLTKAIGSAESLNDKQKEELRSVQYDYEQFMKIATSLMQIITKIIEKPAQAIGR